jgi:alkyl hydroperoxide reductase subunit AhpC
MAELGELERRHEDFANRGVRVMVVSNDPQEVARETQDDFPSLVVVADATKAMARAFQVTHTAFGPLGGRPTNAPTTFLVDGDGTVRWLFRPAQFVARLPPEELLTAIDETLKPRPTSAGAVTR